MKEVWKPIPGFDGYEASTLGRIRGKTKKIRKRQSNGLGTDVMVMRKGGKYVSTSIGRMVLMAHDRLPEPDEVCCHGERGRQCHEITNLSWGTQKKNINDMVRDKTKPQGQSHGNANLMDQDVDDDLTVTWGVEGQPSTGSI